MKVLKDVKVGDYFNFSVWTDVLPGLVVEVKNAKTIVVEELDHVCDKSKKDNGPGHQDWIIFRNNGSLRTFTLRKNGMWVEKGSTIDHGYHGLVCDEPRYYYDWSF